MIIDLRHGIVNMIIMLEGEALFGATIPEIATEFRNLAAFSNSILRLATSGLCACKIHSEDCP